MKSAAEGDIRVFAFRDLARNPPFVFRLRLCMLASLLGKLD